MPTAIVSGASNGLGKALTHKLAAKGWRVFALARSVQNVAFPENVVKIPCNIRDLSDIDQAFEQIDAQAEEIDLLINCAGRGLVKTFEETSREEIMDILGVNLKGNIYTAQEVYKRMILQKQGHIINVGSTSSLKARDQEVLYCASKWGLRGFTESLRLEARNHGIKVTGVYPGGMNSENFWKVAPQKDVSTYMNPNDVAEQILSVVEQNAGISVSELVIERV